MMTRQIIQLRAAMTVWVIGVVLAVSFLPASAPPALAGPYHLLGGTSPGGSGGPDEPDDKLPGTTARISSPDVSAVPAGQHVAGNQVSRLLPNRGFARWIWILRTTVKAYWNR